MTDQEIVELPKVWVVGGDGGMGDIGYQNMSKVMLQNRPNVKALMLDTQVYSNTGGQNSDSTPMLGGNDMNVFGSATQGKNTEKKTVAETFLAGHGSPFVAQVSMANAPKLYRAILDGLEYRGTMFLQCFTTCQPEHGVADDMALFQAQRVRDSRGAPEFVFNPRMGETLPGGARHQGQSVHRSRLVRNQVQGDRRAVSLHRGALVRHRGALPQSPEEDQARASEQRWCPSTTCWCASRSRTWSIATTCLPEHRSFIPDFGVYITFDQDGKTIYYALSRQLVMFCVERRKAWRMLQSKAGSSQPRVPGAEGNPRRSRSGQNLEGRILRTRPRNHGREAGKTRAGESVEAVTASSSWVEQIEWVPQVWIFRPGIAQTSSRPFRSSTRKWVPRLRGTHRRALVCGVDAGFARVG